MTNPLAQLATNGVSIWLDDLSRTRIRSGALAELITSRSVSGVTTNPTIFAASIGKGDGYQDQVTELAAAGASASEAIFEITTKDVAEACDIFADVYHSSSGFDNVMIKIPATKAGLAAITEVIAAGISVNVTLIFSLQRYREVIAAYQAGIALAKASGQALGNIHSVASFFVSRVDTEIDKRLGNIGTADAATMKSKAALANARLAYEVFEQEFDTPTWKELAVSGANIQRPLMASTGVKDPALPDTLYVTELVAEYIVNTMPEKTMEAVFDHGVIPANSIQGKYEESKLVLHTLNAMGISYDVVTELLEKEGVEKFIVSWNELVESVSSALEASK